MEQEPSDVLTVEECAELLKVSARTVYKLVSDQPGPDKIRARKVGRAWRIWREEVERFLRHEGPLGTPVPERPPRRRQTRRPAGGKQSLPSPALARSR